MKNSVIVETFSRNLLNKDVDKKDLKLSNEYIQELASNPNPNNQYEIGEILAYTIDTGLKERLNYLESIADVKRTGYGEKAIFNLEIDELKAMFQAKSATTHRSKVSNRKFSLDTDEVSIRPHVNFLDLKTGRVDLTRLAELATNKMEMAIIRRVQDSVYAAFKELGEFNYGTGSGITKGVFDPILHAMKRVSGAATVLGDTEALAKFTELTGFNNNIPEALAVEHNQNGLIGRYLGSDLMQLVNPFQANSFATELRKDLIYVIPSADDNLKPIKVQFEGDVNSSGVVNNINSNEVEFRFDQHVGVGAVGTRKLLGVYEDTTLSEK